MTQDSPELPPLFAAAIAQLRETTFREELRVQEIPAPATAAQFSVAFAGDVVPAQHGEDSDDATGRFIVMFDDSEPEAWGGPFRIVSYAQATLDVDMGVDPFIAQVAWSWLIGALDEAAADYDFESGTATKVLSTGFGELEMQGDGATLELRAAWSPHGSDFAPHIQAWGELLCRIAGIPPAQEGVAVLRRKRPRG